MAERVQMPKLGLTMEEGTVEKILVSEGDKVSVGDILFEISTDKLANEVENKIEGTVLKIVANEGDTYPVHTLLAIIGEEGEDFSALLD